MTQVVAVKSETTWPLAGPSVFAKATTHLSPFFIVVAIASALALMVCDNSHAQNANANANRNGNGNTGLGTEGNANASERGQTQGTTNGVANGISGGVNEDVPLLPPGFDTGNGNANFPGNGNQFCSIIVSEFGTLGASIENTELSSKLFGGRAGSAAVTTSNGSYSLSIDPPLGFSSAPRGGTGNVNMFASYLGNGATNFSETPGNVNTRLRNGTTTVQTHLSAARADTTPFPAGHYRAEITLRCE